VVEYSYDAWGAPLGVTGTLADTLGTVNPLRYRGYFYDTETGLYYLGSRYYSPTLGRFISADEQIAVSGSSLLGGNLFAYGFNDPVNTIDPAGTWPRWITAGLTMLSGAWTLKTRSWRAALTTLASAVTYGIQVLHYDLREALNIDLPGTREEALEEGWLGPDTDPVGPSSLLHQFTAAVFGTNTKYVSPDGTREAIYDEDGQLVTDQKDVGTYNFSPSGTLWSDIKHALVDMFPWVIFGNGDSDPGPLLDTVLMLFKRTS
jgi:RHS repeat-associated protein